MITKKIKRNDAINHGTMRLRRFMAIRLLYFQPYMMEHGFSYYRMKALALDRKVNTKMDYCKTY